MMKTIEEEQMDLMAFEMGQTRLRGSRFADWVERGVQSTLTSAVSGIHAASQDQEGWHDDVLRGIGTGAKWVGQKWQEGTADQEGIGDDILRSIGGGAKNTMRALDAASYYGGKAGGAIAKSVGVDPRIGGVLGNVAGEALTGFGAKKALQIGKYVKRGDAFDDLVRAAAPEGSTYRMMLDTGGGVVSPKRSKVFSEPLYDTSKVKVNRVGGGYEGKGHLGLANIMYEGNKGFKQKFNKLRTLQQQGPFKHHHIEDVAFTGQWANTSDFEEVFTELNKLKIYPGDSPTNIIGMMDEGNMFLQTGKTDLIRELKRTNFPGLEGINKYHDLTKKNAPAELRRIIDDLFKSPEYGDEFFQGSIDRLGRKTPHQIEPMFETLPDGKRVSPTLPKDKISYPTWEALGLEVNTKQFLNLPKKQQDLLKQQAWSKRWETLGVNRKNIKYDPTKMILSKDHIDTIHYNVYNSPKFTQKRELLKMIEDGSYYKLDPKQKAEKIAEVYKVQRDTSINVAKRRLRLIKNYLKKAEPKRYEAMYSQDPTKLRQWIINNPSISANLGWKDGIPDYKTLTNPKTAEKITDEFKTVFSTGVRELPNLKSIIKTQTDVLRFENGL